MKAMFLLAYLPSHSLGGRKTGEITDRTHDKIANRDSDVRHVEMRTVT